MKVALQWSALSQLRWQELAVRFVIGGAATAATGLIAEHFGPLVGGLFLSFPVIFPAGATLLEKHQIERKRRAGLDGRRSGRKAVALDAQGAALGACGLGCFGLIAWRLLSHYPTAMVLGLAAAGWLVTAMLLWWLRKKHALTCL